MNTKSLSSRYVRFIQDLSQYHFHINYVEENVNTAIDILLCIPQRSHDKEKTLRAKNSQIFHCLLYSLTQTSLKRLSLLGLVLVKESTFLPFHQNLFYGTYALL